jgi:hypothetical protein
MNKVYAKYFDKGAPPTRTTIQQVEAADRKPDGEGRFPLLSRSHHCHPARPALAAMKPFRAIHESARGSELNSQKPMPTLEQSISCSKLT